MGEHEEKREERNQSDVCFVVYDGTLSGTWNFSASGGERSTSGRQTHTKQ